MTVTTSANDPVITVENLSKDFHLGVRLKRVRAVIGASFAVQRGEIFGFVGPNGAGKTTTIRTLMGLIRPSSGRCTILGHQVPSRAARMKVGFLPEAPYFYDYLSARELLELCGLLFGLDAATRARRSGELLARVGLSEAADRPMRKYSKGMLQRAGLAQALINDPEVVVLDEPMSGLDPIGRKEVRDLIAELGAAGKTVFFSTHILPDVEMTCDRVAMIFTGRIRNVGPLHQLVSARLLSTEVDLRPGPAGLPPLPAGARQRPHPDGVVVELPEGADVNAFLSAALGLGASLLSVSPRKESLEDLYVRVTHREGQP